MFYTYFQIYFGFVQAACDIVRRMKSRYPDFFNTLFQVDDFVRSISSIMMNIPVNMTLSVDRVSR